jgi:hypothetical protein
MGDGGARLNPGTQEAKTGGSEVQSQAGYMLSPDQPQLCIKIMSQKQKTKQNKKNKGFEDMASDRALALHAQGHGFHSQHCQKNFPKGKNGLHP